MEEGKLHIGRITLEEGGSERRSAEDDEKDLRIQETCSELPKRRPERI
jgi:hypothetical protein